MDFKTQSLLCSNWFDVVVEFIIFDVLVSRASNVRILSLHCRLSLWYRSFYCAAGSLLKVV